MNSGLFGKWTLGHAQARLVISLGLLVIARISAAAASPQDVLTHHADNLRTGWFSAETQLKVSNVNASSFGLLKTVALDGRVDAEPLYVSQQTIANKGVHNVVYVATENNSIYAIDADTGAVLWRRGFGKAIPFEEKSFDDNVFPVIGILGTPAIDRNLGNLYLSPTCIKSRLDGHQAIADPGELADCKPLETWWPGTELNRRRQPFQGYNQRT